MRCSQQKETEQCDGMRGRSVTSAGHVAMLGTTVSAQRTLHTHTHARAHAPAHTRSQNAPDTERTIRMFSLCSFIFQRANNTWRNTASVNQISDDNLRQVSTSLRARTKLYEKRRTDKVQREKGSKRKTTEEGHRGKTKTARRNNVFSPFVVIGEEGCFCVSLFSCTMIFPFFRTPPQFYADVLLLFLLRLFVLPCRAMQPLSLHPLLPPLPLSPPTSPLLLVLPLPSPLPPLRN